MILERLGVSVRVTNSEGEALPEYEVKQTDEQTMECWIPSTEGTNFRVRWEALKNSQPGLDLMCYPSLDGIKMYSYCLYGDDIVDEGFGEAYYYGTDASTGRLYQFGRRELTDKEEDIIVGGFAQEDLNTIQAELVWGRAENFRPVLAEDYHDPEVIGPINEKQAKKGHASSAELGTSIEFEKPEETFDFTREPDVEPSLFIFRYAPQDWLLAQEIMPRSESHELVPKTGQKRARDNSPEIIDIDDIETDDDDIIIVKHMIPAPVVPKQKRHKAHAQLKAEEDVEEAKPKKEI